MSAPGPYQPLSKCFACGYDMRSLLALGIRRCPECGTHVPGGLHFEIHPKAAGWYVSMAFFAAAPAAALIIAYLASAVAGVKPFDDRPSPLLLLWILATPIYCYVFTIRFCSAHHLPRAAFGAIPVCLPVVFLNYTIVSFASGLL